MPKISHTAAYIVVKFYGLTKFPEVAKKFDPFVLEFYKNMVGFLPSHLSWYKNSLNSPLLRKFFIWSEELLLPGDLMHIICRKYYMTKLIDKALKNGIEQVVSMGAGFDHLGVYTANKGITTFELDRELMTNQKKQFVDENGYQNNLLHFKATDFEEKSLKESLTEIEVFDSKKKTLFLGEGFFDYLPPHTTKEILSDIKTLNTENQLLSTFFSLDELNWFHRFSFTSGVSLVGESLKLPLNRKEFIGLLSEFDFRTDQEISYKKMQDELVKSMGMNLPVLNGFYILRTA